MWFAQKQVREQFVRGTVLNIFDSIVSNNSTHFGTDTSYGVYGASGGAVLAESHAIVSINNTRFTNNTAISTRAITVMGGAVAAQYITKVRIRYIYIYYNNSVFVYNTVTTPW